MTHFTPALHAGTPDVSVIGSANLPVLILKFLRHPDTPANSADVLALRTVINVAKRTVYLYGCRPLLSEAGRLQPDATTITALSGQSVMIHTADGDETYSVADAAGRSIWSRSAQGTVNTLSYEAAAVGGRLLRITEAAMGVTPRVREAFTYAPEDDAEMKSHNLAGATIRHYDNAGYMEVFDISLTRQVLKRVRRLMMAEAELPDWGAPSPPETEMPLAINVTYDATGYALTQTNAAGVKVVMAYDVSGAVSETHLRYVITPGISQQETITLKSVLYRADGVMLSQTAGNGVVETYKYDPQTLYLTRRLAARPAGHPSGAAVINDLHYAYDPAGNILSLKEMATNVRWHSNRMTDGQRTYSYDTLYRLVLATARERLADTARGPQTRLKADGSGSTGAWFPYVEHYAYDAGDNLVKMIHVGQSPWTREMMVSASSNRTVVKVSGWDPEDGFLPGGLQARLTDGRRLTWYADGMLRRVSLLAQDGNGAEETETYVYSDRGARVRKSRAKMLPGGVQHHVTTYAGGCETRLRFIGGAQQLSIVITESGRVRLTENRLTGEMVLRYALTDHLGNVGCETDEAGKVTACEEYYPYGGSAGSESEKKEVYDRTRRYSGKEQDATGLIYYGWRYYQPETVRWLSADPGGLIDGENLFRFCRCNPVNLIDTDGRGVCSSKRASEAQARADAQDAKLSRPVVNLVYGMDNYGGRQHYLDDKQRIAGEVWITIDQLNAVLGIAPNKPLNRVLSTIVEGMEVNSSQVSTLTGAVPGLDGNTATSLLTSWSSFLQSHYDKLSPGRKIHHAAAGARLEVAKNLFKKNLRLDNEQGKEVADAVQLALPEYTKDLVSGRLRDIGIVPAYLPRGTANDRALGNLDNMNTTAFFRQTSKLGLDWAMSKNSSIDYIDFVFTGTVADGETIIDLRPEMRKSKSATHARWMSAELSQAGNVCYPITFSELRHVQRKQYHGSDQMKFRWVMPEGLKRLSLH